jgi:hypothetical protein
LNKSIYKRGSRSIHRPLSQLAKAFGDADLCTPEEKEQQERLEAL